jgi:hypothetical protein
LAQVRIGTYAMFASDIDPRGVLSPVEPIETPRPSVNASDWRWHEPHEYVWLPESRTS